MAHAWLCPPLFSPTAHAASCLVLPYPPRPAAAFFVLPWQVLPLLTPYVCCLTCDCVRYGVLPVLGVPKDARLRKIKSAYRKLVLQYHPGASA